MTALLGGLIGLGAVSGLLLVARGLIGTTTPIKDRGPERRRFAGRAAIIAVATLVGFVLTGWVAAGALAGSTALVAPALITARRDRRERQARTEALAAWAEMLRDTIAAHAGLREAIGVTAEVAPPPIRPAVRLLVARAEHESLSDGLARFADDVGDPVCDLIVAALSVAADGQARNLPALLTSIAESARAGAQMQMRVETGRARTYSSSRALIIITFFLSVSLLVFAPEFMAPFSSFVGQVVMVLIGALFAGALWGLVVLSRPEPSPRLLAGVGQRGAEVPV